MRTQDRLTAPGTSGDLPIVATQSQLTEAHLNLPADRLAASSGTPLRIMDSADALYRWSARLMADEIKTNNDRGEPTRWIIPVGPKGNFSYLAEICNAERISWRNVWAFHMDEYADWQGRLVPEDHPFSFRGYCQRHLYGLLDPDLLPPAHQVVFPELPNIDDFSDKLAEVGGADTCFAGYGFRGHVAFNEPPSTRWTEVTVEEFAASRTRLVPLLEDTFVAHSHRMMGGYTRALPPMALTIGMADILAARKIHLITDGGAWKRYITRAYLFTSTPDVMLPVTLCKLHPNVELTVDAASAEPIEIGL